MKLMITLKKDLRRLWQVAMLTWLMLAVLTNADRWRADWMPSPMEGWMNLVVTGAWACLAALVILQDPLVGDNHFWMTRPHWWPDLLAAKVAFVVLTIHVPLFVADVFVLTSHGFSPATHVGALVMKQLVFFVMVTLPAMAVAALVRSFVHFVVALFVVAAVLAFVSGGLQSMPGYAEQTEVRHNIVKLVLACVGIAVVWLQFSRRSGVGARMIGVIGALAATAASTYLPMRAEYARQREGPQLVMREAVAGESIPKVQMALRGQAVFLPIRVISGAQQDALSVRAGEVELIAEDGGRLASVRPTANRPFEKIDLMASPYATSRERAPEWYMLNFSRGAWERWKNQRVRIRGWAGIEYYRIGETTTLSAQRSTLVPGVGQCSVITMDDRYSPPLMKVLCESTRPLPAGAVEVHHDESQRVWHGGLNIAQTNAPGPNRTWLSPLERAQAFFWLTTEADTSAGAQWYLPASYVASARVEITPRLVTGRAVVEFAFDNVSLSQLRVP